MSALLHHPLALVLARALLHFLWQGALAGLVAALGLRLLCPRSAQARYLFAVALLGATALAPLLTFLLLPRPGTAAPLVLDLGAAPALGTSLALGAGVQESAPPFLPWALGVWAAGVAVLSLRLGASWLWLQRLRAQGLPVGAEWRMRLSTLQRRLGITRSVLLLKSLRVEVPMVLGWIRPVILVPASAFTGLSPEALEAILTHELAHVRRHDYLVNLGQSLVEILLFYHPAVWWISAQVRAERENCCDDVAVACCGDALAYARALAALEGLRSPIPSHEPALAATGGSLMTRIQRLLRPKLPPSPTKRAGLMALVAVSALGAGTALHFQEPGPAAPKASPAEESAKTTPRAETPSRAHVRIRGKVELRPDSPELLSLGKGASFLLKAREHGKSRVFSATSDARGEVRTYSVNGETRPLDAEAQAWLQAQIQSIQKAQATPPAGEATDPEAPRGGRRIEIHMKRMEEEAHKAEHEAEKLQDEARKANREAEKAAVEAEKSAAEAEAHASRKIVIDLDRVHRDVRKQMKELRLKLENLPDVHLWSFDDGEDLDFFYDDDGKGGAEARPHLKKHVILRRPGGDPDAEARILKSTIERLQRRLDELNQRRSPGQPPRPPAPPPVPPPPPPPPAAPEPPPSR